MMAGREDHVNTTPDSNSANYHLNNSNVTFLLPLNRWATHSYVSSVIVPIVFAIIFFLGIIGNGTLIISVLANKVMRNVPNILIVCLSLGDFLVILVSVPMACTYYTFINWPYGTVGCKLNEFLQTLSLSVSVISLTALSADRYLAIVDPMAKLVGRTRKTTVGIAVCIWAISLFLALPDAVFSEAKEVLFDNLTFIVCQQYPTYMYSTYSKVYNTTRLVLFFLLPMFTIAFFYLLMAQILIRSSDSIPTESKTALANQQRQITARRKVARVVLSFVVIFVICWLPTHVYRMWFFYATDEYNNFWHVFKITAFCLQFVNSCINPFALYFLSAHFRKYYNRYLFCCCDRLLYRSLEPTSTMHTMHSRQRRGSATNTYTAHSQSMC